MINVVNDYRKAHFSSFLSVLSGGFFCSLLIACFNDTSFILLAIFFAPVSLFFFIWTLRDKTVVSFSNGCLNIVEVHHGFSTTYTIRSETIKMYKIINQNFKYSGVKYPTHRIFRGFISVRSYSKRMIAIQTANRVIRFGKHLDNVEVELLFKFIEEHMAKKNL